MLQADGGPGPAAGTLTELYFDAVDKFDKPDALQAKIGGRFEPISHRVMAERVLHLSFALRGIGATVGDRVAILSENRPEWAIADYACITARVTDVAVYPSLPAAQIEYILRDSGAIAIFLSGRDQALKVASVRARLPALRCVVSFDAVTPELADMTLAEFERQGAAALPTDARTTHRALALTAKPDDVATFLYTSGTTGEPKGVMLTHDNIHSNVKSVCDVIPFVKDDVCLSFLPLSHIFERTIGHYLMFSTGTSIAYAESTLTVPENMLEVRPSLMVSVPRLYEKMYARVIESSASGGAMKKRLFSWARAVGEDAADVRLARGEARSRPSLRYQIADRLVFSKIRARTGGRLRFFISGGAPLSTGIARFFYAAGLPILEGYGLTETSPVITCNTPARTRIGSVGTPVAGVSVALAEDGEILTRGPNVMLGYYNKPEMTADAIDPQGWFHTGDIGVLDNGFLTITDRKKDLLVTAGGKNVAPQPIEARMKRSKFVAEAVLIGDRRKFPMALVVPDFDQLERWARYKRLAFADRATLISLPEVRAKMEHETLGDLGDLASFEVPKKIALLPNDLSVDRGELTPTLKVKRRVVDEHYRSMIDSVYAEAEKVGSAPVKRH
ncbi:MAG: long-chain fatty acid--CoA ligase [Gemmatimonadota bacterium]|nr:long-chain fatty acid--CoA ligase [Gemmatimonadota bacterium]